jgi:hypothetical protein
MSLLYQKQIKNFEYRRSLARFLYQLTNYISKLVDIWAFSGTIEYAHGAPLMRLKMSNIISLLVLAWNQKGKYYMIPLKKVVLILNILTITVCIFYRAGECPDIYQFRYIICELI